MFLLFAGDQYYPSGGWGDFVAAFPTLNDAETAAATLRQRQWMHIVDTATLDIVWEKE